MKSFRVIRREGPVSRLSSIYEDDDVITMTNNKQSTILQDKPEVSHQTTDRLRYGAITRNSTIHEMELSGRKKTKSIEKKMLYNNIINLSTISSSSSSPITPNINKNKIIKPISTQITSEITSYKSNRRRYASAIAKHFSAQRMSKTISPAAALIQSIRHNRSSSLMLLVSITLAMLCISSTIIIETQALSSSSTNSGSSANSDSASTQPASSPSDHSSAGASLASSILSAIVDSNGSIGSGSSSSVSSKQQQASSSERSSETHRSSSAASSESDLSSSHTPKSVVASLSSAIASAAAAATVAAAQNTLSGGDGRSLVSAASQRHHQQARSPNPLNIAIKIADSIPEVPYHILHNMKKIEHAAPFYNVAMNNKMSAGTSKESSHSVLSNALSSGFGAEQLGSLFRSPLWKRIADGYGEFTSEFRSLFRAPTPMKGPISPTTKLLRDISVPALIMLAASMIPSDWHPVRTRRKSLIQPESVSSIAHHSIVNAANSLVDPMITSASGSEQPNFSLPPQQYNMMRSVSQQFTPPNYSNLDQSTAGQLVGARANSLGDINLQMQPLILDNSWLSPSSSQSSQQQSAAAAAAQILSGQNQSPSLVAQEQSFQQQQQVNVAGQQATRRLGDIATTSPQISATFQQTNPKPVNSDPSSSISSTLNQRANVPSAISPPYPSNGFFSSLTSNFGIGHSKLMNRIINENANNGDIPAVPAMTGGNLRNFLEARQDLDNDKYKYSLVSLNNVNEDDLTHSGNSLNEQQSQKLSPSSKLFSLSAMTHALSNMVANQQHPSMVLAPESGSTSYLQSHQLHFGDKTIINKETLSRRQQTTSNNGVEQRDLSQFLPPSWKELAKRTMSSVQQQATTQWKSIEGQLTNWVQDKLKSLPGPAQASGTTSSTTNSSHVSSAGGPSPVSSIIATVKDTALNMLGLTTKTAQAASSSPTASSNSQSESSSTTVSDSNKRGKVDTPNRSSGSQSGSSSKFAGVANMIVGTLTRSSSSSSPSTASTKSSSTSSGDVLSISPSQYPTLTSADTTAMASGTASTVAGLSSQMI